MNTLLESINSPADLRRLPRTELQQLARDKAEYVPVLEQFARSARMFYKRLSELDARHAATLRSQQDFAFASGLLH